MNTATTSKKYIYWMTQQDFDFARNRLKQHDYKVTATQMTPCEVLKCNGKTLLYATPGVFNRVCTRQGSWYRASDKAGKTMLVSDHKLDAAYDRYLDAIIDESNFSPEHLPSRKELKLLVGMPAYNGNKPAEWEQVAVKDKIMFKSLFTMTGFWKWGDNMKKHWLNHRANHANFLSKQFSTMIDNELVAYSVTENDGVCSSCVEFFNIVTPEDRKLVRACPGAITFGKAARQVYYDILPVKKSEKIGNSFAVHAS